VYVLDEFLFRAGASCAKSLQSDVATQISNLTVASAFGSSLIGYFMTQRKVSLFEVLELVSNIYIDSLKDNYEQSCYYRFNNKI
jgi:hypothetical protein